MVLVPGRVQPSGEAVSMYLQFMDNKEFAETLAEDFKEHLSDYQEENK
jgi:hypothetical protein